MRLKSVLNLREVHCVDYGSTQVCGEVGVIVSEY